MSDTPQHRGSHRRADVIAVVGPTATGKSDLALDLAQRIDAEIVNADALQLYRGMDIGTAKVPLADRRGVPHHQLDVLEPREAASVAAYQREARADLDGISERGHRAIFVGGSGLYLRAALDRLEIPPTDRAVRRCLERELGARGVAAMLRQLQARDPAAAARIEPNNGRRIVRALEVIELTGRPFTATMPARDYVVPTVVIGLRPERWDLDERIARRVHLMWERGLLQEVETLLGQGLREGRTASKALGYRQAIDHLEGRISATEAREETIAATRRYARRQLSWFRPDRRIVWLAPDDPRLLDHALEVTQSALVHDNPDSDRAPEEVR